MKERITAEPDAQIDYVEICDAQTLEPISRITTPAVAALAVKIGKTRLIDNIVFGGVTRHVPNYDEVENS